MASSFPGTNYDGATIKVDPGDLLLLHASLEDAANAMGDQVSAILNTFNHLKMVWTGDSASVAQDFQDRWSSVATAMFGDPDDTTKPGVLNIILAGVDSAWQNYTTVEMQVTQMFTAMNGSLSAPPSTTPSSTSQLASVIDDGAGSTTKAPYHDTAVDETYQAAPVTSINRGAAGGASA